MRALGLVRLIGYSLLAAALALAAVPFARAAVEVGAGNIPPLYIICDGPQAGTNGFAAGTKGEYCGGDKQSAANATCDTSVAGQSPATIGTSLEAASQSPDGKRGWNYTCTGSTSNRWLQWYRRCAQAGGSYPANWSPIGAATTACPPVPEPNECDQYATGSHEVVPPQEFDLGTNPNARLPDTICMDGCIAALVGTVGGYPRLVGGVTHYIADGMYLGRPEQCSSGDALPPDAPPESCGAGQVLVTEGGKKKCVNPATDEPSEPDKPQPCPAWCGCGTKTTNNADGSVDTVVTTWETSGDSGACVKKSYHDPDGAGPLPGGPGTGPPTDQSSQKPDTDGDGTPDDQDPDTPPGGYPNPGGPGSPGQPGQPGQPGSPGDGDGMGDFCRLNPTHDLCKEGGSFGGTCAASVGSYTCEGDAVECAVAKATNELNCAFKDKGATVAQILDSSGLTGKEDALKASLVGDSHDVGSMLQLNQRDLTGSCPAPLTGSVMGASFDIDLTPMCDLAEILGALLMISAALVSARIIAGGV